MLLDEANLSPIEYYWSQFLKNCQLDDVDELSKRKINARAIWYDKMNCSIVPNEELERLRQAYTGDSGLSTDETEERGEEDA